MLLHFTREAENKMVLGIILEQEKLILLSKVSITFEANRNLGKDI